MTSVQPLYSITNSLRTCKTEKVESPDPEDTCYVCMRNFGHVDDENDPDELSCEAVRLLPCGHIVGSECLKLMIRRQGMTKCSHCATSIKISANPVNCVMRCVLSNVYTRFYIDMALLAGSMFANSEDAEVSLITALHTPEHQAALIQLSHRFFAQQLTWTDALRFWLYYMKLILLSTYGAPVEILLLSTLLGPNYKIHLSEDAMRIFAHVVSNIGRIGATTAMERYPNHYFKFGLMRSIAIHREIVMILGYSSIGLNNALRSDMKVIGRMTVVIAGLISYGLDWRTKT